MRRVFVLLAILLILATAGGGTVVPPPVTASGWCFLGGERTSIESPDEGCLHPLKTPIPSAQGARP